MLEDQFEYTDKQMPQDIEPVSHIYEGCWLEDACENVYSCVYVWLSGTQPCPPLERHALMDVNVD